MHQKMSHVIKQNMRVGLPRHHMQKGSGLFDWLRTRVYNPVRGFLGNLMSNPAGLLTNPAVGQTVQNLGNILANAATTAVTQKLPYKIFRQQKPVTTALAQTLGQTVNDIRSPVFRQTVAGLNRLVR